MYSRGMTVREVRGHLEEIYGIDVSPDLISAVTDAVLDEVADWQNRPLDICYPLVLFDAIWVKVRDEGFVRNKAIYIALGILPDGDSRPLDRADRRRQVLAARHERAEEQRHPVHSDRRRRRPQGLSRGDQCDLPKTIVQTPDRFGGRLCIVHLICHSMDFASWKDRNPAAQALRAVYRVADADAGLAALDAFAEGPWGAKYPAIAESDGKCRGAALEPRHSVLRLPRKRPAHHLHDQRDRGA